MRCDTCGNDYDKTFKVSAREGEFVFDSFECAIQKLAPVCAYCGCRVIGHGVEVGDTIYCCENCRRHEAHASEPKRGTARSSRGTH